MLSIIDHIGVNVKKNEPFIHDSRLMYKIRHNV